MSERISSCEHLSHHGSRALYQKPCHERTGQLNSRKRNYPNSPLEKLIPPENLRRIFFHLMKFTLRVNSILKDHPFRGYNSGMADHYRSFDEMCADLHHGYHYRITMMERFSGMVILAIHGGGIEPGTSELALAIAGQEHSIYLFEGIGDRNNDLHITSTHFNDPECFSLLKKHPGSLSIHGFIESENDPQIYMGGCDRELMYLLLDAFQAIGYQALVNKQKYAATDAKNVCNRTSSGKGVQIELSGSFRKQLFQNYSSRGGRMNITPEFAEFVKTIRNVLDQY